MSPGLSAELGWGCKVWRTGLGRPARALPGLPAGQRWAGLLRPKIGSVLLYFGASTAPGPWA